MMIPKEKVASEDQIEGTEESHMGFQMPKCRGVCAHTVTRLQSQKDRVTHSIRRRGEKDEGKI